MLTSALPFSGFSFTKFNPMKDQTSYEAIIVGGSYAGLSAAMALGRSLRQVLIIDSGQPCNRQTPHSHNFITHDGKKPGEIAAEAKRQVLSYDTVRFHQGRAISAEKSADRITIKTEDGHEFDTYKLVLATGVKDIMPDIKGISDCWGISVIHCPYCHGYEFKGKKTGVMANGEHAYHITTLVDNLTDDLSIFTNGKADFTPEQLDKLDAHKISIIETPISEIEHKNGHIHHAVLADGSKVELDALYAALPFEQHAQLPAQLGCELTDQGHIKVDMFQKTNIPGVFACGDNSSPFRAVSYAVATGTIVGSMANMELVNERF